MNELKYIKIINKNNKNYLIEVYNDGRIRKILIKDKYKEMLMATLVMISLHL